MTNPISLAEERARLRNVRTPDREDELAALRELRRRIRARAAEKEYGMTAEEDAREVVPIACDDKIVRLVAKGAGE